MRIKLQLRLASDFLLFLCFIGAARPLPAQSPEPQKTKEEISLSSVAASSLVDAQNGMTQSDLVAHSLAHNPEILAARQERAAAGGDLAQAKLRKNPFLELGGMKEVNGDDNRFSIGGSLPLELFGRRARRTEVAEQKLATSTSAVADRERWIAAEVRSRFGDALAAVRNLAFAEQLLALNREFLRLTDDRARKGAAAPLDADEVRVEVNRIEAQRIGAVAQAELAMLALKEAAGMRPEEPLRVKGNLEEPAPALNATELLRIALAHRPDLAEARAAEQLAAATRSQDRAESRPDASLSASYERPDTGFSQRAFNPAGNLSPIRQTFNYAVFGLTISLPLFDRRQGALIADTALMEAARHRREYAELVVRHDVEQARVRYVLALSQAEVYRTGVRDQADHNLEIVRKTYEYGRTPVLDVIAEQRRYIDIETGYTGILHAVYLARVALERALSAPLP